MAGDTSLSVEVIMYVGENAHFRIAMTLDSISSIKEGEKIVYNHETGCYEPSVDPIIQTIEAPINWLTEKFYLGRPIADLTEAAVRGWHGSKLDGLLIDLDDTTKKICAYIKNVQLDFYNEEHVAKLNGKINFLKNKANNAQAGILRLAKTYSRKPDEEKKVKKFYDTFTDELVSAFEECKQKIPDRVHGISPFQITAGFRYACENKTWMDDSSTIYYPPEVTQLSHPLVYFQGEAYLLNERARIGSGALKFVFFVVRVADAALFACSKSTLREVGTPVPLNQEMVMSELFQNHTGLLSTIVSWQIEDAHYVLMHYYELGSLNYERELKRSSEEIYSICKQLLSGLIAMHELEIVHGDIKPENIFLRMNQGKLETVIADFGGANFEDAQDAARIINLLHMSPETCGKGVNDDEPYPKTNDIWALGCILWHLLTGESTSWIKEMGRGVSLKESILSRMARAHTVMNVRLVEPERETLLHLVWQMLDPNPDTRITAEQLSIKILTLRT